MASSLTTLTCPLYSSLNDSPSLLPSSSFLRPNFRDSFFSLVPLKPTKTAPLLPRQFKPQSCEIKAHKGDKVKVHYRGKLTDGTVFDSSFERGDPIEFELGTGQVIKGWDQGLLGMCVGEKRKLKIPAKLGYGTQGSPPSIPGGATLIFDTELVAVNGQPSTGGETDDSEEL